MKTILKIGKWKIYKIWSCSILIEWMLKVIDKSLKLNGGEKTLEMIKHMGVLEKLEHLIYILLEMKESKGLGAY